MSLSKRERRLLALLAIVLVATFGGRFALQRAGQAQGEADLEGLFASPSPTYVIPSPMPSPTFGIPADARDPFAGK